MHLPAGRGIVFSREAAERARPIVEAIPAQPPAERLLWLMRALAILARTFAGSVKSSTLIPDW